MGTEEMTTVLYPGHELNAVLENRREDGWDVLRCSPFGTSQCDTIGGELSADGSQRSGEERDSRRDLRGVYKCS